MKHSAADGAEKQGDKSSNFPKKHKSTNFLKKHDKRFYFILGQLYNRYITTRAGFLEAQQQYKEYIAHKKKMDGKAVKDDKTVEKGEAKEKMGEENKKDKNDEKNQKSKNIDKNVESNAEGQTTVSTADLELDTSESQKTDRNDEDEQVDAKDDEKINENEQKNEKNDEKINENEQMNTKNDEKITEKTPSLSPFPTPMKATLYTTVPGIRYLNINTVPRHVDIITLYDDNNDNDEQIGYVKTPLDTAEMINFTKDLFFEHQRIAMVNNIVQVQKGITHVGPIPIRFVYYGIVISVQLIVMILMYYAFAWIG